MLPSQARLAAQGRECVLFVNAGRPEKFELDRRRSPPGVSPPWVLRFGFTTTSSRQDSIEGTITKYNGGEHSRAMSEAVEQSRLSPNKRPYSAVAGDDEEDGSFWPGLTTEYDLLTTSTRA